MVNPLVAQFSTLIAYKQEKAPELYIYAGITC